MSFIDKTSQTNSDSLSKSIILMNRKDEDGKRKLTSYNSSGDSYLSKVAEMAGDNTNAIRVLGRGETVTKEFPR